MKGSKLKQGRKAQISSHMVGFIPRIVFTIIVIMSVVLLVKSYITTSIDTFDVESALFAEQVIYSKSGISYLDASTGRLYPGTTDLRKVNSTYLDDAFSFGDHSNLAARIVVHDSSGDELKSAYYNKKWYDRWIVLARTGYTGSGGAKSRNYTTYTLVHDFAEIEAMKLDLRYWDASRPPSSDSAALKDMREKITKLRTDPDPKYDREVPGRLTIEVVIPNS